MDGYGWSMEGQPIILGIGTLDFDLAMILVMMDDDHVGVAAILSVVCGVSLVVHLGDDPGVGQPRGKVASARLFLVILIMRCEH